MIHHVADLACAPLSWKILDIARTLTFRRWRDLQHLLLWDSLWTSTAQHERRNNIASSVGRVSEDVSSLSLLHAFEIHLVAQFAVWRPVSLMRCAPS